METPAKVAIQRIEIEKVHARFGTEYFLRQRHVSENHYLPNSKDNQRNPVA
jgi:hypothetical protein